MLVWVKRHKAKLIVAFALVAGGYVGGRYFIKTRLSRWKERSKKRQVDLARLKEHIESNKQTCLATIMGFLPNLRDIVVNELNAEAITEQLRAKPSNKVELWENLKVVSFARLVSGVYACSLLTLLMRVQLSISGGQMFCEVRSQQHHSTEINKQFLSHFLQQGLRSITSAVRESAQAILVSYSLKHQLSCDGVIQLLSDIRQQLPTQLSAPSSKDGYFLIKYILPRESQSGHDISEHTQLLATRDVLESAEFSEVLEGCVNEAFNLVCHSLTEAYHSAAQSQPTLALAKLIPMMSDHSQLVLSGHTHLNVILQLMADQQLQKLSQNVYEAFAHTNNNNFNTAE